MSSPLTQILRNTQTNGLGLYFAYGSNMCDSQMKKRCPEHQKKGNAALHGYRWIISARGYANVIESAGDVVEGILFEISQSDEQSLDRHEGVKKGLYKKFTRQVVFHGKELHALVYVDLITTEGTPKDEYIKRINQGLTDAALPEGYIARYIRRFIPFDSVS